MKPCIGILASTRATDLDSIVDVIKKGELKAEVKVLVSNKRDALCLERAKKFGIEALFLDSKAFSSREDFDKAIAREFDKRDVEFVVNIGYMLLLSPFFVRKYKNRILNVHPSLLPVFPGMDLNVHKTVLDAGVKITGCTVHLVDEGIDTGPIILQKAVEVKQNDTPETLKERVQAAEKEILPKALKLLVEKKIVVEGKRARILD